MKDNERVTLSFIWIGERPESGSHAVAGPLSMIDAVDHKKVTCRFFCFESEIKKFAIDFSSEIASKKIELISVEGYLKKAEDLLTQNQAAKACASLLETLLRIQLLKANLLSVERFVTAADFVKIKELLSLFILAFEVINVPEKYRMSLFYDGHYVCDTNVFPSDDGGALALPVYSYCCAPGFEKKIFATHHADVWMLYAPADSLGLIAKNNPGVLERPQKMLAHYVDALWMIEHHDEIVPQSDAYQKIAPYLILRAVLLMDQDNQPSHCGMQFWPCLRLAEGYPGRMLVDNNHFCGPAVVKHYSNSHQEKRCPIPPLHRVVAYESVDKLESLLKGQQVLDINAAMPTDRHVAVTALHVAAFYGRVGHFKRLCQYGAKRTVPMAVTQEIAKTLSDILGEGETSGHEEIFLLCINEYENKSSSASLFGGQSYHTGVVQNSIDASSVAADAHALQLL